MSNYSRKAGSEKGPLGPDCARAWVDGFFGVAQGLHRHMRKFGSVPQGVWEMNLGMVLFEAGK